LRARYKEYEEVDWGALARDILADIEGFAGARVAEVALKAAARP
jgi:hypothetical protein